MITAWLFALLATGALAGTPTIDEAVRDIVAEASGDHAAALTALRELLDQAKRNDRAVVLLHLAEQQRLQGASDAARQRFAEAIASTQDDAVTRAATLGLALLDVSAGVDTPSVRATLTDVPDRAALASQNADRFAALAAWTAVDGDPDPRWAKRALAASSDPHQTATIRKRLADAGALPASYDTRSSAEQARAALDLGDRDAARTLAQDIDDPVLRARVVAAANAPAPSPVVGLLLPVSADRYASVARLVEEAVRFGWAAAEKPNELVVVDTGSTPESAVAALAAFVRSRHPVAVLGPVLSSDADPLADEADRLGVPMISMSQGLADARAHQWVLQGWLTVGQQVARLVEHAMQRAALSRFVIVAPESSYGTEASDGFAAAVTAAGGTIVLRDTYATDSMDFRAVAGRIARRPNDNTPPVVDFDAIFLPDQARRVALVAGALAFEEIPMGTFDPHRTGPVVALGLSGWNNFELVAGGGDYVRKGLFTDVFVPPPPEPWEWSPLPAWSTFVTAYQEAQTRNPTPIEALASDVGRLVSTALDGASFPHTLAAWDALLAAHIEDSVTGLSGFNDVTRAGVRDIRLLSVGRKGFVPVMAESDNEVEATPPDPQAP